MASTPDHISMALFCDFENVALGVREANYDKFDIKKVLERLLLKGSIVVKKAYCDWERYRSFKAPMHEANFELIEIPHVRQSGKNSADIRMVVDALDLCYTKAHVNTFVIISGDSDFSPLVSKLRENAKYVIGVGVKQSTSDLLTANCDEFIFYDDLVRDSQRQSARREGRDQAQPRRSPEEEAKRKAEMDARRTKAVELAAETYEALVTDRDEGGRIWASVLKEAIKRRNPGFNENYHGFRTFGNLLEEARARGLLDFGRDEKSGTYVSRGTGVPAMAQATPSAAQPPVAPIPVSEPMSAGPTAHSDEAVADVVLSFMAEDGDAPELEHGSEATAPRRDRQSASAGNRSRSGRGRRGGGGGGRHEEPANVPTAQNTAASDAPTVPETQIGAPATADTDKTPAPATKRSARKTAARGTGGGRARTASKAAEPADQPSAPAPASDAPAPTQAADTPPARAPRSRGGRRGGGKSAAGSSTGE
ncbi:NYN domain-containing protein [Aquabacterium sp. A3]|uniref:NYN domain-containing protein n=1 Tax=Aquabacterium sp. A3 TaxID=3132829 RepID=UPI003119B36C